MKKQIDTNIVVDTITARMLWHINNINDVAFGINEGTIMADWRDFRILFYTLVSIFKRVDDEVYQKLKGFEGRYPMLELPHPKTIDVVRDNLLIRYDVIEFRKWIEKQQEAEEEKND